MLKKQIIKKLSIWFLCIVSLVACVVVIGTLSAGKKESSTVPVIIRNTTFTVRLADSEPARTQGLSGVKHLGEQEGMLFVFDGDDKWGIWMKDMHIPIDIIWLDKNRSITHMKQKADPRSFPEVYRPEKQSRYVIELPAGTIEKKGIGVGDMAEFTLSKDKS